MPNENRDKSVAVLPLDSRESPALADELRRRVITRLTELGKLRVVSSGDSVQDKASTRDLREIGKRLGVTHLLVGNLQAANNRVRVSVFLFDVATEQHVWADDFDRDLTSLSSLSPIESEITTGIAHQLVTGF
jgi:adenylate cyclase